jgi:hypothetical protein
VRFGKFPMVKKNLILQSLQFQWVTFNANSHAGKNGNSYERNTKQICDPVSLMYISQKRTAYTVPFLLTEERESPSVMIRATPVPPEY